MGLPGFEIPNYLWKIVSGVTSSLSSDAKPNYTTNPFSSDKNMLFSFKTFQHPLLAYPGYLPQEFCILTCIYGKSVCFAFFHILCLPCILGMPRLLIIHCQAFLITLSIFATILSPLNLPSAINSLLEDNIDINSFLLILFREVL